MKIAQHVTNLELSQKLKELGVKQESIFNHVQSKRTGQWGIGYGVLGYEKPERIFVSAFLASELGEMLPYRYDVADVAYRVQFKKLDKLWTVAYFPSQPHIGHEEDAATEADARAKLLIHLIEQKIVDPAKL